jgi:hypothetical protein
MFDIITSLQGRINPTRVIWNFTDFTAAESANEDAILGLSE